MPGIDDLEFGYSTDGVTQYLEDIKANSLEEAKKVVLDTSSIEKVCEAEWVGQARVEFIDGLKKDAQHVADQFDNLYKVLESNITSVQNAMANKDQELFK